MSEKKAVDKRTLDEIIRRVVEVAHPDRIIMFGSAARGEMGSTVPEERRAGDPAEWLRRAKSTKTPSPSPSASSCGRRDS